MSSRSRNSVVGTIEAWILILVYCGASPSSSYHIEKWVVFAYVSEKECFRFFGLRRTLRRENNNDEQTLSATHCPKEPQNQPL